MSDTCSLFKHREASMHSSPRHTYPPVFTVDPARAGTEPPMVPCWTFPPAQVRVKKRGWRVTGSAGCLLIMVFLTVFAALGLGTYQIMKLQTELLSLKQVRLFKVSMCLSFHLFIVLLIHSNKVKSLQSLYVEPNILSV